VTRAVDIVDTTTRDGNQSLWGATGLTATDILAIAPTLDRVGFHALDFTSSTHMAVSVRFHREDPWELIRLLRAAMPNTPLNFITTGMRFIAWSPCDEDLMRLAFRCVVRSGIRLFKFWFSVGRAEQLRRFLGRAQDPLKQWKVSPIDDQAIKRFRVSPGDQVRCIGFPHAGQFDPSDGGFPLVRLGCAKRWLKSP
jgi:pyruvate carboxylase